MIASLGSLILLLICILWARWSDRRPSRGLAQVRRPRRARPWRHKPIDWAVIDGSNVLFWNAGVPSLDTVAAVVRQVQARGMEPVVWFDANVGYRVGERWLGPMGVVAGLDLPRKRVFVAKRASPPIPACWTMRQGAGRDAVVIERPLPRLGRAVRISSTRRTCWFGAVSAATGLGLRRRRPRPHRPPIAAPAASRHRVAPAAPPCDRPEDFTAISAASSTAACRASGSSATASSTASSRFTSSRRRAASSNSRFSAALRMAVRSASRCAARFWPDRCLVHLGRDRATDRCRPATCPTAHPRRSS